MNTKIPWFYPLLDDQEKRAVAETIDSGYINDGEVTKTFEDEIAKFIGCKHAVAVTNGTSALTLSLMALGVGLGDEVIVPDFTFIATANAVRLAGAKVKLVDIEPSRFTIDPNRVKEAVNPKTKAIISVDVNGRGADYDSLESIRKEYGIFLICDSAEALGSKYKGRYLGTFGDAGCFSFSANKTISSGQGGMIATNNKEVYNRLCELKDQGRRHGGTGGNDLHPVVGFNFKYTNLQAAIALAQLKKINKRLDHFRSRDSWYTKALKEHPEIEIPSFSNGSGEVKQWADLLYKERSRLESAFKRSQIDFRPFWHPLHTQNPYKQKDHNFECSMRISKRGLWLPSSFEITEQEVMFVSKVIHETITVPTLGIS